MQFQRSFRFDAPRERVWELLLDPEQVRQCIGGAAAMTTVGGDVYEAEIPVSVGPFRMSLRASVTLQDQTPPDAYTLLLTASGAGSSVTGRAGVALAEEGDHTLVRVQGEAEMSGLIGQIGDAAAVSAAESRMAEFFECMQARAGA